MTGRERGPDRGEGRRVPRRNSYDVEDPRARPWSRIGDGSVGQGLAYRDALMQVATELHHQGWKDAPAREVRAARARRAAIDAEQQQQLETGQPAAPAPALRRELARLDELIERARVRLRSTDLRILSALIRKVDFATGQLFPAIETIAEAAACHRNSVIAGLRRLKFHGLVDWVRRTIRTDNEAAFAPQREQTSNAYFFSHRTGMAPRVWQRYWQILVSKLRRATPAPAPPRPAVPAAPPSREASALRSAIDRLGATLVNAST